MDPKHYLSQFHIKHNAKAGDLAKEQGHDTWVELFRAHDELVLTRMRANQMQMSSHHYGRNTGHGMFTEFPGWFAPPWFGSGRPWAQWYASGGEQGERPPDDVLHIYEVAEQRYPLRLFVRGADYKLWGLFDSNLHLFGVEGGTAHLFGTDGLGRDMFSRMVFGARVSLSIGLIGVVLSFVLGIGIGGASGYFGGATDVVVQRLIEFIRSIPVLPLWMALAAALPVHWSAIRIYFGITIIVSLIGWTDLARVVRGKLLSLREEDFVMAGRIAGTTDPAIITRHLIPSFLSYVIVALTLSVPSMILAETSLSFLGLGLRPPVVSWGVLLSEAQNIHTLGLAPWLLIPGLFIIVTVLAFNFVGDGLRDAADPYASH